MEKSKVYFYNNLKDLKAGVNKFFEIIAEDIGKDNVGLKIHFGEKDNDTHIDPDLLKDATNYFDDPKFVECNVLYRGQRTTKKNHIKNAKDHGFGFLGIDILDGKTGEYEVKVKIDTKNTKEARLGKGLVKYKKLVALTHFKGHGFSGFGGAIKNIGMGLGSRGGKLDMHSSFCPTINKLKCTGCGVCKENCNFGAIQLTKKMLGKKAQIDAEKCAGCAMCIAVCPTGAVQIPWGSDSAERLMEKMAEYTLAAVKGRKWWYINFVNNITYLCDCKSNKQKVFMKDIGILLSDDPVAIDQASMDLIIKQKKGVDPFKKKHGVDGQYILEYAEKIGLGSRDYDLEFIR